MKILFFSMLLTFFATSGTLFGQSKLKVIKAGKLIDVVSGTILTNQIILIDSNKISYIGNSADIPKNALIIDLSNGLSCTPLLAARR